MNEMQTLTEKIYKLRLPGGLFDEAVVRNMFPETSPNARKLLVHRAVSKNEVLRLKPGLYCLAGDYCRSHPHPFVVAAMLHSPSHISLESALSYYGLIPEAVYQITSVTARRRRSFSTPLGDFSFQRVPSDKPRAGVRLIKVDDEGWAFIAGPLRSIADLIYLRKDVTWDNDGLRFLTVSMCIDEDDLREIPLEDFEEVFNSLRNQRTRAFLKGLREEIKQ